MSNFSEDAIKLAQETQEKYGVPASVTLAQYALESGYGSSTLAKNANNYFGITGSYNGKTYVRAGRNWRKYDSMEQSFDDHGALLAKPLYADKTAGAKSVSEYVTAISETYAPSSDGNNNYAGKLMSIINDNNLTQYDNGNYSAVTASDSSTPFWDVSGKLDDAKNDILSKSIKVISIIAVAVLALVFFFNAFNIPITKAGLKKKVVSKATEKITEKITEGGETE